MPSISTLCPRRLSVMFFQLSIRGVIGVHGLRIVGAQKLQRLFGEHDAESPGRAFGVLLEQVDLRVGMTPFPEISEV